MDFNTLKDLFLAKGYELIHTQDNKRYALVPIHNPHCMWDFFDTLESLHNKLMALTSTKQNEIVVSSNKQYLFAHNAFSLYEVAKTLSCAGYDVLVWKAEKGQHHCKIFCKDSTLNLENIIIDAGKKQMGFSKMIHPFEEKWSGYYIGGWIK